MQKCKVQSLIALIFSIPLIFTGCIPSIDAGYISYNHSLLVDYGEFNLAMQITGAVGFMSSKTSLIDNGPMYSGAGACDVSISGAADECIIDGSGSNAVTLKGTEFLGQILFAFNETWYQPGSVTFICPDGSQTIPLPKQSINHRLVFPVEDGYTIERSASGQGVSGTYSWTLHIDY